MRVLLFVFILVVNFGCISSKKNFEVLNSVIDRMWEDNIRFVSVLTREVEYGGNRKLDLDLLDMATKLLKLRRQYNMPENSKSIDVKNLSRNILSYMNQAYKMNGIDKVEFKENYLARASDIINNQSNDELKSRMLIINLFSFEFDFFTSLARKMGSSCGFSRSFNFNSLSDTARVNQTYKVIISMAEIANSYEAYNYHDIIVTFEGKEMNVDTLEFGSSVMISFTPKQSGKYIIKGKMKVNYKNVDTDFDSPFQYEVYATN